MTTISNMSSEKYNCECGSMLLKSSKSKHNKSKKHLKWLGLNNILLENTLFCNDIISLISEYATNREFKNGDIINVKITNKDEEIILITNKREKTIEIKYLELYAKIKKIDIVSLEKNNSDINLIYYYVEPPRDKNGNIDYENIKNQNADISYYKDYIDTTKDDRKFLIYMKNEYLYIYKHFDNSLYDEKINSKEYKKDECGNDYIQSDALFTKEKITTDYVINKHIEILFCS